MSETDAERIARFRQAVADLGLPAPDAVRDTWFVRLGLVALLAGPITAVVAWAGSHGTTNPLSQRDFVIVALIGVAVTVAGAALFVAGSSARFLRFWLARLLIEIRGHDDPTDSPGRPADPASTTLFASPRKDPFS